MSHAPVLRHQLMRLTLRILGRNSLTQAARESLEPVHRRLLPDQEHHHGWVEEGGQR